MHGSNASAIKFHITQLPELSIILKAMVMDFTTIEPLRTMRHQHALNQVHWGKMAIILHKRLDKFFVQLLLNKNLAQLLTSKTLRSGRQATKEDQVQAMVNLIKNLSPEEVQAVADQLTNEENELLKAFKKENEPLVLNEMDELSWVRTTAIRLQRLNQSKGKSNSKAPKRPSKKK
uniref:Uncharacterized protein n=1 Tax=Ditylenchus dipsaci TaxID=166011 RepID=A0A915ESE8_9BILA